MQQHTARGRWYSPVSNPAIWIFLCMALSLALVPLERKARILQQEAPFCEAVIRDGRVYLFQPDRSITILDAASGDVLLRGGPAVDPGTPIWNFRKGFSITLSSETAVVETPVISPWSAVIELRSGRELLPPLRNAVFYQPDNRLYGILGRSSDGILMALDTVSGAVLWSRESPQTHHILADGEFVYAKKLNSAVVYTPDGEFVSEEPLTEDLKQKLDAISHWAYKRETRDKERADDEALLGESSFLGRVTLSERGVAAVTFPRPYTRYYVQAVDRKGAAWKSLIRSHPPTNRWLRQWKLAADNNFVVVSGDYARIECFRRSDGRSMWIYAYPRLDMEKWEQRHRPQFFLRFSPVNWVLDEIREQRRFTRWLFREPTVWEIVFCGLTSMGRDFYTRDKWQFDEDTSPAAALWEEDADGGESAAAGDTAESPRIVIDPKTLQFDTAGARIARGACLLAAAVMYCLLLTAYVRRYPNRKWLLFLAAVILVNSVILLLFGRFDRVLSRTLYDGAFICFFAGMYRLWKGWRTARRLRKENAAGEPQTGSGTAAG